MKIDKVIIENFKCFKDRFELTLNDGVNILVGDNEAGKSTILEAIHLALTGYVQGRYFKAEFNQYLFNNEVVDEYLKSIVTGSPIPPPQILIEIYLKGEDIAMNEGDGNSANSSNSGFSFKINFDDKYNKEYEAFVQAKEIKSLPIEYYQFNWLTFSRDPITPKFIPMKSALIDSSSGKLKNGSDIYIGRIVKDLLTQEEVVNISQAYRKMKDTFMVDESIKEINEKVQKASKVSDKEVKLSVELSSMNAWENSLITYLDDTPFHHIGKGEQCIIKTRLALSHKKSKEANIILLEEPENHLSHTKLNQLIRNIKDYSDDKQILISTHSSFVANKLGLDNLILLNDKKTTRLNELSEDTKEFFLKLSGYDTLRMILCDKAILVEGDSDELIVQKAYLKAKGKLPIEDRIDVISVGVSFLRFLELSEKLSKKVVVVTDNDGNVEAIKKKYINYLGVNSKDYISICFDEVEDTGTLEISGKPFNYNTLEPKVLKANNLSIVNKILGTSYDNEDELLKHMRSNKTKSALKFFSTEEEFSFPDYILASL